MITFGIVQGRLLASPHGELQWFPGEQWPKEFSLARDLGITFIELIAEREHNPNNPIWSSNGRELIMKTVENTGRSVYSTCNDFIINHRLIGKNSDTAIKQVFNYLSATEELGCKHAVIPLLEENNITNSNMMNFLDPLKAIAEVAKERNINILIESLLDAYHLREFIEKINEPNVACVYDTGNRALYKSDIAKEILHLDSLVKHVHIKDKNKHGINVLLGTGLVNFLDAFKALSQIDYAGPLVFETERGSNPILTAEFHMQFCNYYYDEAKR